MPLGPGWRRSPRVWSSVTAIALGVAVAITVSPGAALGNTPDQPAIAIGSSAVVFLETTYTGYLRDSATGKAIHREPLVYRRRCTGVVVNPDGYVVAATACVKPNADVVLTNALYLLGRQLVDDGQLPADGLDNFVAEREDTTTFSGSTPQTTPGVALSAQFGSPVSDDNPLAVPATVTKYQSIDDGDVALVRLGPSRSYSLQAEISDPLHTGQAVVILAYGSAGSAGYALKIKTANLVQRHAADGVVVDADLGPYSRGGAVVNSRGRLIGILENDESAPGTPVRRVITTATIAQLLASSGVSNRLDDVDLRYRDALADYFAGRYSEAVGEFVDVVREAPEHPMARDYLDLSRQRLDSDGDAVENSADWSTYALSALAGTVVIYIITSAGAVVRRRLLPWSLRGRDA